MKYKELKITWGGQQYIFVTRGRAKEFSAQEAIEYLQNRPLEFPAQPIVPPKVAVFDDKELTKETSVEATWSIPDDRSRRHMFHMDLQRGIEFCVSKYGQSEEAIKAEAKRLALGGF